MAEASKDTDFSGLGFGDETRRNGDYVGVPHDYSSGGTSAPEPGQAVSIDGSGNLKKADDGETIIGVLSNYPRAGDSGGPSDPAPVIAGQPATVKTRGTVKAEVSNDGTNGLNVSAGDALGIDGTNGVAGVLDSGASPETSFVALSGATEDNRYDGSTAYYAEVLLR